jgi:hypothetical protein
MVKLLPPDGVVVGYALAVSFANAGSSHRHEFSLEVREKTSTLGVTYARSITPTDSARVRGSESPSLNERTG